jgi:hypothetical protein
MNEFKEGETYYVFIGVGKPYKIHIVAVVDEDMVVYKYYGRHKQRWHYAVRHREYLAFNIDLTEKRCKKR